MNRIFVLVLALMIGNIGLFAQDALPVEQFSLNFEEIKSTHSSRNFAMGSLLINYNAKDHTAGIDLRKVKNGRNYLMMDRRTGRKLYLIAKREGRQVAVKGFAIQNKNGTWFRGGTKRETKAKHSPICPPGFSGKQVCYTVCNDSGYYYCVYICYWRCTATDLTLSLPDGV